jgi:RNA polymerase sigma-70 factor (family 1)
VALTITDTELIPALHKGDPAAFEAIYHHFIGPLHFFLGRMVKDEAAAEDIAIVTFSKVFKKNTDFHSVGTLKSYLYTIAANAAIDHARRQKRRERAYENFNYLPKEEMENAELVYIRSEAIKAIHQAMETLPEKSGQVIRMIFVEGKKLQEIAEELAISYNTVQNHRKRGLELVRNELIRNKLLAALSLLLALSMLDPQ